MIAAIKRNKNIFIVWFFIIIYIAYFSYYTVLRYLTLYASYFDLGIMHQTVFNTYRAITNHDWSRVLELTNPFGPNQIKRLAIHNDIILAPLALFYLIYASPATLLILQSLILGLGAWFVFKIGQIILFKLKYRDFLACLFALSYLFYPPLERANMFNFHAVTFATTSLLAMFYFWLSKRYGWSFTFVILSLFSKEEVGLTTVFFGAYVLWTWWRSKSTYKQTEAKKEIFFGLATIAISLFWFFLSIYVIIPYFHGANHFALGYYGDFGDTPTKVIIGILANPPTIVRYIFTKSTLNYLVSLLGPLGFISLLSPMRLLIALPELAINLLSNEQKLRNIFYHYSSVITPFVFISGIYGLNNLQLVSAAALRILAGYLIIFILFFAYLQGPLPLAQGQEIHPFKYPQTEAEDVAFWSKQLKNEDLKLSSTGQLAPFFTSRRYFFTFSPYYYLADYVVLRPTEIYNYPEKKQLIPVYEQLKVDKRYQLIFNKGNFEVYKKND